MNNPINQQASVSPKEALQRTLEDLFGVAIRLQTLYDHAPELNDTADIAKIIPCSLDEWVCEIQDKLEDLK